MKRTIKILIIIVMILLLSGTIFILTNKDKKEVKTENKVNEVAKEEYYKKMRKRMYDYYKIMYKNLNIPEEKRDSSAKIFLAALEKEGFPMEDFVSYDGKEKCDTKLSYAIRRVVNERYVISVYYKCGKDTNYDSKYLTTTTEAKQ